jgi:hypothetical protein
LTLWLWKMPLLLMSHVLLRYLILIIINSVPYL